MRVACVLILHFPAAVERLLDSSLRGRPVVVGETPDQRKAVLDCSPEAAAEGVRPGMPLRQALALCRDAVFLPPHPSRYREAFDAMLEALEGVSPEVEESAPGRAYLNVEGLAPHYEGELDMGERIVRAVQASSGLVTSAGVGEGKFVAWAAAVTSEPGQVCTVPAGKEADFLRPLDLSLLPASSDTLRRLDLYGLRSIGDLAEMPLGPVQAQFGVEGKRLWELAGGIDLEPLRPRKREEVVVEGVRFPAAAVSAEALVVACRRILVRLQWRLRGRAVRQMRLRASLWGGRSWEKAVTFHEPAVEWERMLFVAKSVLANTSLPGPVEELAIELSGLTEERGKQSTLFAEKGGLKRQLGETVQQLRARWGRPFVSKVVEVEPWSRLPERRHALIDYEP